MPDRLVTCTDHPDQELVPSYDRNVPSHVYGRTRVCEDPRHTRRDRHRCAWCGRQVFLARSYTAVYCSGRCRVAAHRDRQRALADAARAAAAAAPTGTPAGGIQPPADALTRRSS